eukprot:3490186-Alexandrium_andersonii.AAC.1
MTTTGSTARRSTRSRSMKGREHRHRPLPGDRASLRHFERWLWRGPNRSEAAGPEWDVGPALKDHNYGAAVLQANGTRCK